MPGMNITRSLDLPTTVTKHTISVRTKHLCYLRTRAATDLPKDTAATAVRALLVPGFTGSKEDFLPALPWLQRFGVDAVAFDQAGQFESTGPDDPHAYGLEQLAIDVSELSHRLWPTGPRPHLLGHSLGGLVARMAVLQQPEDFASLTLLASGPGAVDQHQRHSLHTLQAVLPQTPMSQVWAAKRAMEIDRGDPEPSAPELALLQTRWLATSPIALKEKAGILLSEVDRTTELAQLPIPIAVMYGSDDDVWWPHVQSEMASRLQAAEVCWPQLGHSPILDNAELASRDIYQFFSRQR